MNKNLHRIVFNRSRGLLMAVQETASSNSNSNSSQSDASAGNGASSAARGSSSAGSAWLRPNACSTDATEQGRSQSFALTALCAAAMLAMLATQVRAQIVVDHSAPGNLRPNVTASGNGVPIVNIQTPSAAGVSRNVYRQFDVQTPGAVLNNSRTSVQTQLGGWVQGNASLTSGTARVILNEVNSSNATLLKGHIEVGGDRAQVIVANPSGISCNGCGFINASQAALTTGTPVFDSSGNLESFLVQRGQIDIWGAGLDASATDYTAILARTLVLPAGIWAKDLNVVVGANQVSAADGSVLRAATPIGEAPSFALDSSSLGGMYAGKIKLIATESGVGVRHAGAMLAGSGGLALNSHGLLTHSGVISSTGAVDVDATLGIESTTGSLIASGVAADGSFPGVGATGTDQPAMTLRSTSHVQLHGQIFASGSITSSAATIDLSGSDTRARDMTLTAFTGDVDVRNALLDAAGVLRITTRQALRADDAVVTAGTLDLSADSLGNRRGDIAQTSDSRMQIVIAGAIDNASGRIASNAALSNVSADRIDNTDGKIIGNNIELVARTSLLNGGTGTVAAQRDLKLSAGSVANEGHLEAAGLLDLRASGLIDNAGLIYSAGAMNVVTSGALVVSGAMDASGAMTIEARTLSNGGGSIAQHGNADSSFAISGLLDNRDGVITSGADNLRVTAADIDNDDGLMAATGKVALRADSLSNRRGQVGSVEAGVDVSVSGTVDNTSGRLESAGTTRLQGIGLTNVDGVVAGHGVLVDVGFGSFDNSAGRVHGKTSVDLRSGTLTNASGSIRAGTTLGIDTHGYALSNTASGTSGGIVSQGSAQIRAGSFDNRLGFVGANGGVTIETGTSLVDNRFGIVTSASDIAIDAGALDNRGGVVEALGNVAVVATGVAIAGDSAGSSPGSIDNSAVLPVDGGAAVAGLLRAGALLTLKSAQLDNRGSLASSVEADLGLQGRSIQVDVDSIDNRGGAMRADERLDIRGVGLLDNSGGQISSAGTLRIGDLDEAGIAANADPAAIADPLGGATVVRTLRITNTAGEMAAGERLTIDAAALTGDGVVSSSGDVQVALVDAYTHQAGARLEALNDLRLSTAGGIANEGLIAAGATLTLQGASIDNAAEAEISAATTKLSASAGITNRGLIDGDTTLIDAGTLLSNVGTGRIYGDHLSIRAATLVNGAEHGTAAVIAARTRLDIGAGDIENASHALLFSAGDLSIGGELDASSRATGTAATLTNDRATIEALGSVSLNATEVKNLSGEYRVEAGVTGAPETVSEYSVAGQPERWSEAEVTRQLDPHESFWRLITPATPDNAAGDGGAEEWRHYQYTRTTTQSVLTSFDPARILSGGSMKLEGGHVLNSMSWIVAGGALTSGIGSLENVEVAGERVTSSSGTLETYWRKEVAGADHQNYASEAYEKPNEVQAIRLTSSVVKQFASDGGGSGTSVGVRTGAPTIDAAAGASAAQVTIPGSEVVAPTIDGALLITAGGPGHAVNGSGSPVVRTALVSPTLPNNSLFKTNAKPGAQYLVETDPRFANYREWLGSDFLLAALKLDPAQTQKRLGDGFYEQQLLREQVLQLTGRRFLDGYSSDEDQFRALMENGVDVAREWQLVPGVALDAAQVSQLTTDMVWLIEQNVTLPDGSVQRVLVPQVYVRMQSGDADSSGALIAGSSVDLKLSGNLTNSGRLSARTVLSVTAENVRNAGGRIEGADVALTARQDLDNLAGLIAGVQSVGLVAGRDLNVVSSTRSTSSSVGGAPIATVSGLRGAVSTNHGAEAIDGTRTAIDRVATVYVTGAGGTLVATAGRDVNLLAANIVNSGTGGSTQVQAGRDVNLSAVRQSTSEQAQLDAANWRNESASTDTGSRIETSGNVAIRAGRDVLATAAVVQSDVGSVSIAATRDVSLLAGREAIAVDEAHSRSTSSLLSSKTVVTRDIVQRDASVATSVSGQVVRIDAGHDVTVSGSEVVSTAGTAIKAGNDLVIDAARNTSTEAHSRSESKSGLFSAGGLGVTLGLQQKDTDTSDARTSASASTIGSVEGNVTLLAGNEYRQVGSNVVAPVGDIDIAARRVSIEAAESASASSQSSRFEQVGVTLAVSTPALAAYQAANAALTGPSAGDRTDDARMKALDIAGSALAARKQIASLLPKSGAGSSAASGASDAANPSTATTAEAATAALTTVSVSLTAGASQRESSADQSGVQIAGSTVSAGRNVRIAAVGGAADSTLIVKGSAISAGNDALLVADGNIDLLAADEVSRQVSSSSGSSASAGLAVEYGSKTSAGWTLSGSASKGRADGSDVNRVNTTVQAGNALRVETGGNLAIKGATIAGDRVVARVAGDLAIESLQDTSVYTSKNAEAGASVTLGAGSAASVNLSRSKVDGVHAAVRDQSGVRAGDGGFDIVVGGNTDLKGAYIASSKAAADSSATANAAGGNVAQGIGLNRLVTGTLTTSDIVDIDQFEATGFSVSAGTGPGGTSGGFSTSEGNRSAITASAISGASITIGNAARQAELTGKTTSETVASLNRDVATDTSATPSLSKNWDGKTLQEKVAAEASITAKFASQASQVVGDYAAAAEKEALQADDPALAARWAEGGAYRIAAHAAVGALSGNVQGALGAGTSAATVPDIAKTIDAMGLPDDVRKAVIAAAGSAIGAAVGGGTGAAAGLNQTANNYLKHEQVLALVARLKGCATDKACREQAFSDAASVSSANDKSLQACKATGDCSSLLSEYRSGSERASDLAAGLGEDDGGRLLLLQANGFQIVRSNLSELTKTSPERTATSERLFGMSKGIAKLTLVGRIGGAVSAVNEINTAIQENGLSEAVVQLLRNVSDMPAKLVSRLNSPDPAVRGEALIDALDVVGVSRSVAKAGAAKAASMADDSAAATLAAAAERKAQIDSNHYRDGSIADPSLPMSATGNWKPVAVLSASEANALTNAALPATVRQVGTLSADVLNAESKASGYSPEHAPGTDVMKIITVDTTPMVRVFVGTEPSGSWVMRASDIAGLTPQQIASKYSLP